MTTPQPRNFFGRFGGSRVARKPGRAVTVRDDLTHCYWTEKGDRASLQGMRCKIIAERTNGRLSVEFENGERTVVHKHSLKRLPGC